jgi:phenylacetate-CoA ligase
LSSDQDRLVRQRAAVADGLFAAVKRLRWSAERLAGERERRLRILLDHAAHNSSFHRDRLRDIDPATIELDHLPSLPVMTKDELMAKFDEAITNHDLTLRLANDHLEHGATDGYLLDRFRVLATGGTSGRRGVFVYDWDEWVTLVSLESRWRMLAPPPPPPAKIASLFAGKPGHMSGALHAFSANPSDPIHHLPVTMPLDEIVSRLNEVQPVLLQGFPTALDLLVGETRAGRLRIAPEQVKTCGEFVFAESRQAVREVWGVEIEDCYGLTEGVFTSRCDQGAMHLPDDLVIVEPVDDHGSPVAPGRRAAKIYLTNLYNLTQPLIRYELTDSMIVHAERCACGSAHSWISDLGGRRDDTFVYPGGSMLHSVAMCGALLRDRHVVEYQVRQTDNGIDVAVRTNGPTDLVRLRADLHHTLVGAQLVDPQVTVWRADRLERLWSGKLRRFVPLGIAATGPHLVDGEPERA